jgi:DNA-binding transcriptional LysR family regulator
VDRLASMQVFARVAELESFTGAARALGLPKATVSSTVQRLEDRLGARLLQRTTRRVQLTHDGRAFYERCKDLLADAEEVEALFQQTPEQLTGRIRVDMPSRMARFRIIPALPQFLAAHPALELEVGSTDRAVDLVREGYDCVVRVGGLTDSGLIARRLGEMRLVNVASPAYLKRYGTPRSLKDLPKHFQVNWVGAFGQKPAGWEYEEDGVWKELPMRGLVTVNNAESYVAACIAGLGLIQVPKDSLEHEVSARRLVEVLPRHAARPMPISIVYPHRRQLSRRVRVFIDWLASRLGAATP